MLQVWLYFRDGRLAPSPQYAGKHRRALYHNGMLDLQHILKDHVEPRAEKNRANMLVTGKSAELSESAPI